MSKDIETGWSMTTVTILAATMVLLLGWGLLAASYAGGNSPSIVGPVNEDDDQLWIPVRTLAVIVLLRNLVEGVSTFVYTAVVQIPHFFTVLSWHVTHRLWLLILVCLMPLAVIAGGFGMKRLESKIFDDPRASGRKATQR